MAMRALLKFFPPVRLSFAYGSGVFRQDGEQLVGKCMDVIFVVDNPISWHHANIHDSENATHYSFVRWLGVEKIVALQRANAAGVYFNTLVTMPTGQLIKYGVIEQKAFVDDLTRWDALYIAGRLQKPVKFLTEIDSVNLTALQTNLRSAVLTACIFLPEKFTLKELYMWITALSYRGDFRMKIGEDRDKVRKIVTPNMEHFNRLYVPVIQDLQYMYVDAGSGVVEQDGSFEARLYRVTHLPLAFQQDLATCFWPRDRPTPDLEDVQVRLAAAPDLDGYLEGVIQPRVFRSSVSQTVKSALTAGVVKSVVYAFQKLKKMARSVV